MSAEPIEAAPAVAEDEERPLLVSEPGTGECNWLICDGYGSSDPRAHHRNCPGNKPRAGWRARVSQGFVLDEVDRIMNGECEDTPTFRGLAVETCIEARYGQEIAS